MNKYIMIILITSFKQLFYILRNLIIFSIDAYLIYSFQSFCVYKRGFIFISLNII